MRRAPFAIAGLFIAALGGGYLAVNSSDCNAVVSMSQGGQVYNGQQAMTTNPSPLEDVTGEQWMLLFKSGATIGYFTTASNWNALSERHRCGTDAQIDRIVFIFDPRESGADNGSHVVANLNTVSGIVAKRYPNAEFVPVLLVGADNHVICVGNGAVASRTHKDRIAAVNGYPNAGPDLDIPCAGYADTLGHLKDSGAADANAQVGAFFEGG